MKKKLLIGLVTSHLLCLPTVAKQTIVGYQKPSIENQLFSAELSKLAIEKVTNQVADWQLAQFDIRSNMMRPEGRPSGMPNGWMYAPLHSGLVSWGQVTEQEQYVQAVINLAHINQWLPGPRLYHADDHAMSDVYLDLYELQQHDYQLAPTKATFDKVIANPKTISLYFDNKDKTSEYLAGRHFRDPACTGRWCWADAIFMAPPALAHLSKVTDDPKYLEFLDKEFWATTEYLYDKEASLFLRDSRYFDRRDAQGNLIYWSRGNGWVLAGIARTLKHMPDSFGSKPKYIKLFKEMSKKLISLQNDSGNWPSSLLDRSDELARESSGTALIIYALSWGISNGILDEKTYFPAISAGWKALVANVHPDGKVGWVQQVAFAPGSASKDDTQLYGSGALIMAASEIIELDAIKE